MERKHLDFLCNLGELSALLAGSANIESFLQRIVELVARHLQANVCSIYLYEEISQELILKATVGLKQSSIGQVHMRLGEGLVGTCLKELRPIREASAQSNPHFKYFHETGEEHFQSFLAVPIQRGVEKIGAIVVQHEKIDYFTELDVAALRASASQLASAIENARVLIHLHDRAIPTAPAPTPDTSSRLIKGEVASSGYAFAPALIWNRKQNEEAPGSANESGDATDLENALDATARQLGTLQKRLEEKLPEIAALIFTAHQLMLKDTSFTGAMLESARSGTPARTAVQTVAQGYMDAFARNPHAYMREKSNDVEDLARRILANLSKQEPEEELPQETCILIAEELFPSDILKLTSENVGGVVLVSGGVTSHVAILARSLDIPLLIADNRDLLQLPDGTPLLLDAETGNLFIRPEAEAIRRFEERNRHRAVLSDTAAAIQETTHTRDGTRIHLRANINLLSELPLAKDLKAEGVGLYRTEFPFLIRQTFPSEEEQYFVYRRLIEAMPGQTVTIRSLDVGGDKVLAYWDHSGEPNPELGLRSIRFSLRHPEIFRSQLRAILRAGADCPQLRIAFPMISSLDEFREARAILCSCADALALKGIPHNNTPTVGMMVEVPSVVPLIDDFLREADFLSIGTNDFVQYMLGVDRTNEKVAAYYQPHHPAVLRSLAHIVGAARKAGKDVSVCGEMAHETLYLPFLIGIGVRTLSVDPHFLPMLQSTLATLDLAEAEQTAQRLLSAATLKETEALLAVPAADSQRPDEERKSR